MNDEAAARPTERSAARGAASLGIGAALTAAGWAVMWGLVTFWNLFGFWALWTGAALLMWEGSRPGYPGVRRHAALAAVSVPLWWWFELVDARTQNWSYESPFEPGPFWYVVLGSVAFSTVVPAIVAATALVRRFARGGPELAAAAPGFGAAAIGAGLLFQALVFAFPAFMYPFVWVAPFLLVDGIGIRLTGRGLLPDLLAGRWREAAVIGGAGLLCGLLWEFWNYWSVPSWEYDVPLLGFWKVFEMPLLGYLGYIPFAWSIVRLVDVLDALRQRSRRASSAARRHG
ncbi:MAG: hypothetical protein JXB36_16365 [Gammaproteobacteria bacterium]|nr:hypothetical protein [Gammaproteobacteria bacterium]